MSAADRLNRTRWSREQQHRARTVRAAEIEQEHQKKLNDLIAALSAHEAMVNDQTQDAATRSLADQIAKSMRAEIARISV